MLNPADPGASRPAEFGLVALNGPTAGTCLPLDPARGVVTLGRDESRELPVDDPLVSRLHARVWHDGNQWQLEDCGSSNGTWVNSQWVQRTVLEPGDVIRVGDRLLIFLRQQNADSSGSLSALALTADATTYRVLAPQRHEALLERTDAAQPGLAGDALSTLYRFATQLYSQGSLRRAAMLAAETVLQAARAGSVRIWLTGATGRLRRLAEAGRQLPRGGDEHLLPRVVMERDEALSVALPDTASATSPHQQPALAVPVPGRQRPRGAIECWRGSQAVPFAQPELDLVLAIAHLFGMAVEIVEHRERLEQANEHLRRRLGASPRLVGQSPAITQLLQQVQRVAPTSATVLILGESGTGKELVAQTLHEMSPRAAGPFVAVNCAAFNESLLESELFGHEAGAYTGAETRRLGQFERAHHGTIFLDEVGELSPGCQAKLLRILEGHPFERLGGSQPIRVDVRIVAATHRDLQQLVQQNIFRQDLYYRLRVIELQLPPLRQRGDDILRLAARFLEEFRQQLGRGPSRLSPSAANAMLQYGWPGNVRELRNAIERAVVLGSGEEVEPADLALPQTPLAVPNDQLVSLEQAEQRHIQYVLQACEGNKTQACRILGISRATLYNKIRQE